MAETQLLKIRIKPGKTARVVDFIRGLLERRSEALAALQREGMLVESFFLERHEQGDFLYYYVKSEDLRRANAVHTQAQDRLTAQIREFVAETWGTSHPRNPCSISTSSPGSGNRPTPGPSGGFPCKRQNRPLPATGNALAPRGSQDDFGPQPPITDRSMP